MPCRVCAGSDREPVVQAADLRYQPDGARYDVLRCRDCGVLATALNGGSVDPAEYYPAEYGAFGAPAPEAIERARSRRQRAALVPHVALHRFGWLGDLPERAGCRVLEVGCATGKIALALAAARGWQVQGIEPDARAAEVARSHGLETHTGTLASYAGAGGFDVVLFVHVLEHLPDPLESLLRARDLLADDGHLVVALPNAAGLERRLFGADWDGWDLPRHQHHFDPASLCGLLERAGFAPGPVRHEWYSLLARSAGNRWRSDRPYAERRKNPLRWLEAPWGFALAACRSSSAIQVVARRAAAGSDA